MTADKRHEALARAVGHFNDPASRERYFELYAESVVFHGYPPGAERLAGARDFYRRLWNENPGWMLEVTGTEDVADGLRVHFTYGPNAGLTTLRFEGDEVVERWQGR